MILWFAYVFPFFFQSFYYNPRAEDNEKLVECRLETATPKGSLISNNTLDIKCK